MKRNSQNVEGLHREVNNLEKKNNELRTAIGQLENKIAVEKQEKAEMSKAWMNVQEVVSHFSEK